VQAPPGPAGPQLSPDGNYWWDGQRWVPLVPSALVYPPPAPYRLPPPSPGLRTFLLLVLGIAAVVTSALGALGTFALADYAGMAGPYDGAPIEMLDYVLIGYFWLAAGATLAATAGVAVRGGTVARVVTIVAGVILSVSCVGSVLGIPMLVAAIRAPMSARSS
jgi:hypothetical protein